MGVMRADTVRLFFILCILISGSRLFSQEYRLDLVFDADDSWLQRLNYKEKCKDSSAVYKEISSVVLDLQKRSFFAASCDSISFTGSDAISYIHLGDKLNWARLKKGNVEEEVLSRTGYRDKIYNRYRFRYAQFGRFVDGILSFYEDNGYPFVSLTLDSIRNIEREGIDAVLKLEKNRYVEIDTVEIYGGNFISDKYLFNYLGIKPHRPYNESNVKAVSRRIGDLTFIGEQQPPKVIFTETSTHLQLFLNKKRASRFDGIIGFLQEEKDGSVQLTGDVKLSLANAFKRGEHIALNWRGLPYNTQDLNMHFNYPYLLNSPFGIDLNFKLYKRDSTFLDIISGIGIPYFINARDYLKVQYESHSSNLLSTMQYKDINTLPPVLDFHTHYYGGELNFNKVDYLLNPTRGFRILINGMAGFKTIQKNINLPDSLYDAVQINTIIFKGQCDLAYFLSLAPRHVLVFANKSAYLQNPQILRNEMFRIGGLRTLRGFDTESIFVSSYVINTFEYRFILDRTSNINVFTDVAYTEKKILNAPARFDTPFCIGAGTNFETRAGIFSLSYAVGSQQGNPLDIRGAKIHFGFLNYF